MPLWSWLGLVALLAFYVTRMWRAWALGYVKFGPFLYNKNDSPVTFWFLTVVLSVCLIFLSVLFAMIVFSTIWGPIAHQN